MSESKCSLCDTSGVVIASHSPNTFITCPQCGRYKTNSNSRSPFNYLSPQQKIQLSAYVQSHQSDNDDIHNYVLLDKETIKNITSQPFPTPAERAEATLKFLCQNSSVIGERILISPDNIHNHPCHTPLATLLALSYSHLEMELDFLLQEYLSKDKKYILCSKDIPHSYSIQITSSGWACYHDLMRGSTESNKVFVASWFNLEKITPLIDQVIWPALNEAGYEIDWLGSPETSKQDNDYITNRIIAGIKQAKFVIADLTSEMCPHCKDKNEHPQALARGGVYYEAGYAKGLGKEVILMCHEDVPIHFDLDQHYRISWIDGEDGFKEAKTKLFNHIMATVGKGKAPRI